MKLDIKLGAVLIFSILALGISSKQVFASSTASLDQITQLSVGSSVVDTTIAGNYLYATSIDDTLFIVDISDPENPVLAGSLTDAVNLNGAWGVKVSGNYAYVTASDGDRFVSIDISNPAVPVIEDVLLDAVNFVNPRYFVLDGTTAVIADFDGNKITSVDISDPQNMSIITSVSTPGGCSPYRIETYGGYVYVTNYACGRPFMVYEIVALGSGPSTPLYGPTGIGIVGGKLFVSDTAEIQAYDITTTPGTLIPVGSPLAYSSDNIVEYPLDTDFFYVLNVDMVDASDLDAMSLIATSNTGFGGPRAFAASGEYVFGISFGSVYLNVLKTNLVITNDSVGTSSTGSSALRRLLAKNRTQSDSLLCSSNNILRMGSRNSLVSELQEKLNISVDGIFGNQTQSATMNYQTIHNLAVDGVVGMYTRNALCNK